MKDSKVCSKCSRMKSLNINEFQVYLKPIKSRASSTFDGLEVNLKFIYIQTFHSRALRTNLGVFHPGYGPTQHFPDRQDIWTVDDSFDYESDSLCANERLIEYYDFYSNGTHSAKRRP